MTLEQAVLPIRMLFDGLRWVVGTGLIYAEWSVYTTPVLRNSTPLAVLWYLLCAAAASPFLLLWLPLEAATIAWLRLCGVPTVGVHRAPPRRDVTSASRSPSRSRSPATHAPRPAASCADPNPSGSPSARLRVASYNIQSGVGSDMQLNLPRVARALQRMGHLDLVALQEVDVTVDVDQVAEIARLAGFAHHAFVGTRPSKLGVGEYGDAVLSRLPIEETHVLRFRRWWLRAERACLFVKVRVPPETGSSARPPRRSRAIREGEEGGRGGRQSAIPAAGRGDTVWFGSAHLQHDITALENGAQLQELQQAIAGGSGSSLPQLPGGAGRTVVGVDANMLGWRLVHDAAAKGLAEHCGVQHPSTFPAVRPLYRCVSLLL